MGHDAMQMSALYLVLRIREHYSFYNCNVKMSNKVKRGLFYTSLCTRRRLWAPLCHAEIQRVIWYQAVIVTSILMSPISTRSVLKLKQNRLKKIKKKIPPHSSFSVIFYVSCCGISYSPHLEDVSAVLASSSAKRSLLCCIVRGDWQTEPTN